MGAISGIRSKELGVYYAALAICADCANSYESAKGMSSRFLFLQDAFVFACSFRSLSFCFISERPSSVFESDSVSSVPSVKPNFTAPSRRT